MEIEIQTTADGSNTLFVPALDEHYHSIKGALTESQHIFIKMGLHECKVAEPRILEVGFGTGLNAILTLAEAEERGPIHYTTLERYPLSMEVIRQLGYDNLLEEKTASFFPTLHEVPWNEWQEITEKFRLRKIECDLTTLKIEEGYDVIYYDAFAPEKQPDMWTQEIFDKLYACMAPDGIFVTYCAKGVVRRMLQTAGFTVERLAGPPNGKREILRGRKSGER